MSTTIINVNSFLNGLATDITSVELESEDGTYGMRRTDNGDSVKSPGTDLIRVSPGSYQIVVTDPADDLTYDYILKIVYGGETYYYPRIAASVHTYNNVFSIPTTNYYSSEAEVMRIIGESGLEAMLEDWESTDTSPVWKQILSTVDSRIDTYLSQRYERSALLSNAWVRNSATLLACHLMSMRRNNPGAFINEASRIQDELDQMRVGRLHVPGAGTNYSHAPAIRNYRMQMGTYHPMRVIQSKSTGNSPGLGVPQYAWEPYFYGYAYT